MNKQELLARAERFALGEVFNGWSFLTFNEVIMLCNTAEEREKFANVSQEDPLELNYIYSNEWWENIPGILNGFKYRFFRVMEDQLCDCLKGSAE
jgi:hypothetical protein